jgi:DNA invertase Pin-like site-specific DNA recombinase
MMTLTTKRRRRRTQVTEGSRRIAVGYIRVSTLEQAVEGLSLDAQRAELLAAAERLGLDLVAVHEDAGVSGRCVERAGLNTALQQVAAAGGVLIAKNLTRLSRRASLTHTLLDVLDATDADLVLLDEGIDTASSGVCGRLILGVLASVAQHQAEQGAATTKAVLQHLRQLGRHTGGSVPYGFRSVGGELVEDADEQAVLTRMRELRAAGLSVRKVAQALDAEGRRPRGVRSNGVSSSGRWHPTQVQRLLAAGVSGVTRG